MKKRYIVELSTKERECLELIVDDSRQAKLRRNDAKILLLVDQGKHGSFMTDVEAAEEACCKRDARLSKYVNAV